MKSPQRIIIPVAALCILGTGNFALSSQVASAASTPLSGGTHWQQKDPAEKEVRYEKRLKAGVTSGLLTTNQETLLIAEHNLLKEKMDALKGQSKEARHAGMKAILEEGKNWATTQKIPQYWLFGGHHHNKPQSNTHKETESASS